MRHASTAFTLLSALALAGCSLLGTDNAAFAFGDAELAFDGAVTFTTVEGGAWVLVSNAGRTYEPVNLLPAYQREGLRVRVEAEFREDLGSFLMVGPIIEIKRIQRL